MIVASETFHHTGSFRFRTVLNLVAKVYQDRIITASSGNFGQVQAYACRLLGKSCTVVLPETCCRRIESKI